MAADPNPTVRRRRLGSELRKLRETAGLRGDEVAGQLAWSTSKVSRVETGRVSIRPRDVELLLDLYEVKPDLRDALTRLARESRLKGWWHAYGDVLPEWFEVYVGLEAEAAVIREFELGMVPGLLQTREYAAALLRARPLQEMPDDFERRIDVRMNRQSLLTKAEPTQYWAVLDEAVLRRPVGGEEIMRAQLDHLITAQESPNVTVQVLPYSAGAHVGIVGSFIVMEFPEEAEQKVVHVESMASALYMERRREVGMYMLSFDHLRAAALGPQATVEFITQMRNSL